MELRNPQVKVQQIYNLLRKDWRRLRCQSWEQALSSRVKQINFVVIFTRLKKIVPFNSRASYRVNINQARHHIRKDRRRLHYSIWEQAFKLSETKFKALKRTIRGLISLIRNSSEIVQFSIFIFKWEFCVYKVTCFGPMY